MPEGNLLAMVHDITERERIEARLHRLVDSNVQVDMYWSTSGRIDTANDALLRIVGLPGKILKLDDWTGRR